MKDVNDDKSDERFKQSHLLLEILDLLNSHAWRATSSLGRHTSHLNGGCGKPEVHFPVQCVELAPPVQSLQRSSYDLQEKELTNSFRDRISADLTR